MKNRYYKKSIILGIIFIFIGASIISNITGQTEKTIRQSIKEVTINFPLNYDYVNAFWKFDECSGNILGDSSGHNYNGTINGATWTTDSHSGCALDFDGINNYVDLNSHAAEIMFNKTDDIILSFYFKSTGEGIIFSATAPWGYNPEFRIELMSNGSLLFYKITQLCGIILYSNGIYDDGDWHYVEYYYNGITSNPTLTLYVDNILDNSITHWLCDIENDDYSKTTMGMHAHYLTDYFDGIIDEFKIIKYAQGNEQQPPTIDGPEFGDPGVEYDYTFVTNDPENDNISLEINWGDGSDIEETEIHASGEEVIVSHSWDEEGIYNITARSLDIWDHSRWSDPYPVGIGNQPPYPPTIDGTKCGKVGVEYEYNFSLSDPDDDSMYLRVDWGNGTPGPWIGPFASGTTIRLNHTWNQQGTFTIRAHAKDIYNAESDWATLDVNMPKYMMLYKPLLLRLLEQFPLLEKLLSIINIY